MKKLPNCQSIKVSLTIHREPFRELIQDPGYSKPDLTYHRKQPQSKCIAHRICDTIMQEDAENDKT